MALFLLDTNICIYIAKRRPPEVLARFESLQPDEAALSVITYGELRLGAEKSMSRTAALERLERLTEWVPVLSLPQDAAVHYGIIRATLELQGRPIGANDLWIAAHALAGQLTLISNNTREFKRIPGLLLEDWVANSA